MRLSAIGLRLTLTLGILWAPFAIKAQQPRKVPRSGFREAGAASVNRHKGITSEEAMNIIYGEKKSIRGRLHAEDEEQEYVLHMHFFAIFPDGTSTKALLVTQYGQECRPCSVGLEASLLKKEHDVWKPEIHRQFIAVGGFAPGTKLLKIGTNRFAIAFEIRGGGGTGIAETHLALYVPGRGQFDEIFSHGLYEYFDETEKASYTYKMIQDTKGDFSDLVLIDNKHKNMRMVYHFDGKKYVLKTTKVKSKGRDASKKDK